MKRILALLLCLMMCLSLIPAACAEDIEIIDVIDVGEAEEAEAAGELGDEALIAIVETETETVGEKLAAAPTITKQPASRTAYVDTTAKFAVQATGATSYQWQYRTSASGSWKNSGLTSAKTATLSLKATSSLSGYQYRCAVKNASGTTYSYIVTLTVSTKPVITAQPSSKTAGVNDTVQFAVKATGATSYQWQYRTSKTGSWHNSGLSSAKTATLSVKATDSVSGYQYRCAVKNAKGTTYSYIVTLTLAKPVITKQPSSKTAAVNDTVKFAVQATGATSYQWQYRTSKTGSWQNSGLTSAKTATLSLKATSSISGYQYRCAVKNASGTTYSYIVTLTVSTKPVITTHPTSRSMKADEVLTFTVKATGATSYQWQYRKNSSASWKDSGLSTAKMATLTVRTNGGMNGYQYRCAVTNAVGTTYSNAATLSVTPGVTAQPLSYTASEGATVKFTVEALGATSYQWQYRTSASGSWKNSGSTGNTTATLSVGATTARSGFQFRCKLKNSAGTVYSETATLTTSTVQCGESLHWTLDSNGLMTISGTGEMNFINGIDWTEANVRDNIIQVTIGSGVTSIGYRLFAGCSALTSVTIPDSVTSINSFAFFDCSALASVKIPNSVTSIGDYAFSDCSALTSVTIPNSVTSIDYYAFGGCSSLTSVTIGNSVTSIGDYAFRGCNLLTSVTIPDSVTDIGSCAFYECSALTSLTIGSGLNEASIINFLRYSEAVTKLVVSADNPYCTTEDNVLFNKDKTWLLAFPRGRGGIFRIPDSVTSIGWGAFSDCSALTSVIIGNSVTNIRDSAFFGCSALTSVTIGNGVTSIGKYAFYSCIALKSVTIGNSVTSIGDGAFEGCSALTSITIPDSVTSIGDMAFYGCSALTSVVIPDSVTDIGGGVFYGCESLKSASLGNGIEVLGYFEEYLYDDDDGDPEESFYGFFEGCSSLTSVTIPDSVTVIGWRAFLNCSKLKDVYYKGTKTQWNKIDIDEENDPLMNATIHYNA